MSDLKFRSSLRQAIWIAIAPNLIFFIIIPLCVLWVESFGNLRYPVVWVSLLLLMVFILYVVLVASYFVYSSPLQVKLTGINGHSIGGNLHFVAWDEIEVIEPYSYFGCKYLRLFFNTSTKPLWIPLFLVHQKKFNQAVIDRTSPENPLHIALSDTNKLFKNVPYHGKGKNPVRIGAPSPQSSSANIVDPDKKQEHTLKLNSTSINSNADISPWMVDDIFSHSLEPNTYGYCSQNKLVKCSRPSLIENLKSDKKKLISLVWTPEISAGDTK